MYSIFLNDILHYLDKESQLKVLNNCLCNLNQGGLIFIRDGDKENDNHIYTIVTEFLSTKVFCFNKLKGSLNFIREKDIRKLAIKNGFNFESVSHSKITSNKLFILRK